MLYDIRIRALFDTGASHSFIDRQFAELHSIHLAPTLHLGRVIVPDHTLDVREFCPRCPVRVGDWIMPVDLLALHKLGEFDVVLGMDWLTQYYATIDCTNRTVIFREPGQQEFVYKGCQSSLFAMTISSSRARQLIRRGCVAYLASISVSNGEAVKIDDIPVVREFGDVFPAELPVGAVVVDGGPGFDRSDIRLCRGHVTREIRLHTRLGRAHECSSGVWLFAFALMSLISGTGAYTVPNEIGSELIFSRPVVTLCLQSLLFRLLRLQRRIEARASRARALPDETPC
uniref:Uncharacterized protein n=1 Tax=Ananas comosus var. bracteatus TaxID=296719 RepID=A0A6V7PGT0_ANACO|nr:unnamed protein product [Ananas comosus var. bracteatus]